MYDFDMVFEMVMDMVGSSNWWELFDSDDYNIVESKLVELYGLSVLDSDEYYAWYKDMADEL